MVAASAAAELRAEVRALDLIELLDLAPCGIADCAGDVDFELQDRHRVIVYHGDHRSQRDVLYELLRRNLALRGKILAMRKPLVQHEVHDHSGHGNVHPQRPGPARDGAMLCDSAPSARGSA